MCRSFVSSHGYEMSPCVLCHHTIALKTASRPTRNTVKCQSIQCDLNFCMWRVNLVEIYFLLMEAYRAHVMSQNPLWMCYRALIMGTQLLTRSTNLYAKACPQWITMCYADTLIRADKHIKLTHPAKGLDTVLGNAQSSIHDQLDYRKVCTYWGAKEHHRWSHSSSFIVHHAGEQLIKFTAMGDKTLVYHVAPKTEKAAMIWNSHYFTQQRNSK